ncbi:MAG: hypothetical protein ACR2OD_10110 [Gaiellaceae bacterium]
MAKSPVLFEAGDFALDRVFHSATETFPFVLPTGAASSGPGDSWFLLDLSYTIVFGAQSAEGFAWVSADTNGLTAAQAEYVLTRDARGLEISESTVTLQDGQEERTLEGLSASLDYVNYARDEGVVNGRNSFTIRVEHTDGVVVERIEFHGDSGVSRTTVSPDPFQLSARVEPDKIRVGEQFEVKVRATNAPKAELGEASIEAVPNHGFARLLDPAVLQLGSLPVTTEHTYRFEARRAGTGQVAILGSSARNEPHAIVDLTVLPASSSNTKTLAAVAIAGAAPLVLMAGVLVVRARRRR